MRPQDLTALETAMRQIGADLLDWRSDTQARVIHSKAEMKLEADRRAHVRLSKALSDSFPGVPVISEEDAEHLAERPEEYWLIDPIDGTASWFMGFDGFVTQAAFVRGSDVTAGLIYAPATDRFFLGLAGQGAWLNSNRLPQLARRASVIMTDNTPAPHGITQRLAAALPASGYVESGSLGLKACLVASGDADIFVKDVVVRDWDLAPAWALLHELGAEFLRLDGKPFLFEGAWEKHDGFVIARTAALARRVIEANNRLCEKE